MRWKDPKNLNDRIKDGVIAVTQGSFNFIPSLRPNVCENSGALNTNALSSKIVPKENEILPPPPRPTSKDRTLNGCTFAYGRGFDYGVDYSSFDYVSIWIGTVDSNGSTHFNKV